MNVINVPPLSQIIALQGGPLLFYGQGYIECREIYAGGDME